MKNILILALAVAISFASYSQNNERKKPSWGQDMPERQEQPDMDLEINQNSDFGLSREDLFSNDSPNEASLKPKSENLNSNTPISQEPQRDQTSIVEKPQVDESEAEKLLAQQAKEAKLIAQQEAEEARLLVQKAAEDEKAKQLAQQTAEAQRLDNEKEIARLRAENEALKQAQQSQASKPQPQLAVQSNSNQKSVDISDYSWKIIKKTPAKYPVKAIRNNEEGWVDVELTINSEGIVTNAVSKAISRNSRVFVNPAINAVKKWKYEAPRKIGITESLKKTVRITFRLN